MCQDCLLKELGGGTTICDKHGTSQIDWKCMYCCSPALFKCFGTHYFCNRCHDQYNSTPCRTSNKLYDCHGINCPLGMAHPPPSKNPREGGVFPLGCGICRSEKLELLQKNRDVQQIVSIDNLPKFWNKWDQPIENVIKIDRPVIEIELPDFIAMADEILEAEQESLREYIEHEAKLERDEILEAEQESLREYIEHMAKLERIEHEAERERIQILNRTPVAVHTPAQIIKEMCNQQ